MAGWYIFNPPKYILNTSSRINLLFLPKNLGVGRTVDCLCSQRKEKAPQEDNSHPNNSPAQSTEHLEKAPLSPSYKSVSDFRHRQ